jgi:hypothetical protein
VGRFPRTVIVNHWSRGHLQPRHCTPKHQRTQHQPLSVTSNDKQRVQVTEVRKTMGQTERFTRQGEGRPLGLGCHGRGLRRRHHERVVLLGDSGGRDGGGGGGGCAMGWGDRRELGGGEEGMCAGVEEQPEIGGVNRGAHVHSVRGQWGNGSPFTKDSTSAETNTRT